MKIVLDMADRRPIWDMPAWVVGRIQAALPRSWSLQVTTERNEGSADGAARVAPELLAGIEDAGAYLGYGIAEEVLRRGTHLRWVHSGSAGIGSSLTPEMLRREDVVFTNSAGVHAPPMGEAVVGMILYFTRGFDFALEGQRRGEWVQDRFYEPDVPLVELAGATVGIVGFGGIGYEIGRRVAALGARVLGLVRRPRSAAAAELTAVGSEAALGRAELLHGDEGLQRLLAESHVVVIAAPDTQESRGMIDRAAIARMRRSVIVINVSRGRLMDEDALIEALREGRVRGAGLDVFSKEPVPAGHPIWSAPNTLLTPHVSAITRRYWERETDLIVHNVEALAAGRPLRNVVDRRAGY